uniref:Uncharacterized protein n=1 Tax=Anguilla anguilla TaxID=7936 RepID=A0A0E9QEU4_ANGAN
MLVDKGMFYSVRNCTDSSTQPQSINIIYEHLISFGFLMLFF